MTSCPVCGAGLRDSTKFCGKCGSRQEGRVGQPASEPLAQNVLPEMPLVEQPGRSLAARLNTALVTAPGQSLGASPAIQTRTPIVHTATAISPENTTHEVKAVSHVDAANEVLRPEIEVSPESGTIDPGSDTGFISSLSAPPVIYVSPQPAGWPASPSVSASLPGTPTGSSAPAPAYEDVAFQAAEPGPLPVSEPLPPLADWPTTAPFYGAPTIAKPPALSRASGSRRIMIAVASLGIVALATLAYWVNHPTNREPVAEQARLSSLATGLPSTLEEARAEVASLEKKVEGLRTEISGLRDAAMRQFGLAKDPFETATQFEARKQQAEAQLTKLAAQYEDQYTREIKPYRARIGALMAATYAMPESTKVESKTYDADRSLLVAALNGADYRFSIPLAKARTLSDRRTQLTAETSWDGVPALVSPLTGERFKGQQGPWLNPKDGLEYVRIAPGTFIMGCSSGDSECEADEKPAHRVTLTKGFRMGVTAVTQEAYQRVMRTNPSNFKGAKLPVEQVNWTEAQNYCSTVGMRLPTEAEWEYAARAGTTGARYGELDTIAWYNQNSGSKTHEVGQKAPNAWGLYDMLGNVWQWTGDWYADEYQGGNETDPKGPASGKYRTLRGGSWNNEAQRTRASNRNRNQPDNRNNTSVRL